jgi:Protein of unknown function (DUF3153)
MRNLLLISLLSGLTAIQNLRQQFAKLPMIVVAIATALLLAGCVDSDVSIRFDSPNQGAIIQQIHLGERFQSLNDLSAQQWLKTIEQQAKAAGGSVQRAADQTLTIKIPFANSSELEEKFNRFFDTVFSPAQSAREKAEFPSISAHLTVEHNNFIFLERNHLRYEADLRSLGVQSSQGALLVSPAALIQLHLRLITPWGATRNHPADTLPALKSGRELNWTLVPGEQNILETTFWMPNSLGIGSLLILLFVVVGRFLKYSSSFVY